MNKTLYVSRQLINPDDFINWAMEQGFDPMEGSELHTTIAYSKEPVDWSLFKPLKEHVRISGGKRILAPLGDKGTIVLKYESNLFQKRWKEFIKGGCSWDWPEYQPHVSITYSAPDIDITKLKPYEGKLVFGPEIFKEVDLDWKKKVTGND